MIAVGDSHVVLLDGLMETHHVGAATAHNLISPLSRTGAHNKLCRIAASTTGPMLFIFGEIDCRLHLVHGSIEDTVSRYLEAVEPYRWRGLTLQGVAGAAYQGNVYGRPDYADSQTRGRIVLDFNRALEAACERESLGFLDMRSFHDSSGLLRQEYTTDGVHLDVRAIPFYKGWLDSWSSGT